MQATGNGQLIMAGTSWLGWDSVTDLYFAPLWDEHRRDVMLNSAPAFTMTVQLFLIQDQGAILTSCPGSNLTWGSGTWNGGIVGGRSTIKVVTLLNAGGALKALRYANVLWIMPTATFIWTTGNFSLANGANIIVEGIFDIRVTTVRCYMGEAYLLGSPDPVQRTMLVEDPGRQWNAYYDDSLPENYRSGWYTNPTCGDECLLATFISIQASGVVACVNNANVTFVSPLNLIDTSQLIMGTDNYFELFNGGICGNYVVFNIGTGTLFTLSGGALHMETSCTIKGAGELLVVGGTHDLGVTIDAHITIQNGTLIWPSSRANGQNISFKGGLLIELEGILQVEALSTTIVVYNEVIFKDNSQILFPAIGIAAQPSMYDRSDAPDVSPRGNLTIVDVLTWDSGLIYGKVDIFANTLLYLTGGNKNIKFLAKLVNLKHAEWSGGNIITESNVSVQ